MSSFEIAVVVGCWCLPLVCVGFAAWTSYSRRNWAQEDEQATKQFLDELFKKDSR